MYSGCTRYPIQNSAPGVNRAEREDHSMSVVNRKDERDRRR